MEPYKIDFHGIQENSPAPGVRSKACERDGKKFRLVVFTKEFVENDWCRKGHIGYMLDGELDVNFSGKTVIFKAGDGIFIPAGENHKHIGKPISEVVRIIFLEDA